MAKKKLVALITCLSLIPGYSIPVHQIDEETWTTRPVNEFLIDEEIIRRNQFNHFKWNQHLFKTASSLSRNAKDSNVREWLPPDAIPYLNTEGPPIPQPFEKYFPGASYQRPLPKLAPVADGSMNSPRQPQKLPPVPDGYRNIPDQPQKLPPVPDGYRNIPDQPQKLPPVPDSHLNSPRQPQKSGTGPIYGFMNIPGDPRKFVKDAEVNHPLSNFNQMGHPLMKSNQGAPVDHQISKFDQDVREKHPFEMKYNIEIPISTLPPKATSDLPNDPTRFFLGRNQNINVRPNLGNRGRPVQSRKVIYEGQTQSWEGNLLKFH